LSSHKEKFHNGWCQEIRKAPALKELKVNKGRLLDNTVVEEVEQNTEKYRGKSHYSN
jgi:hypothetical protein